MSSDRPFHILMATTSSQPQQEQLMKDVRIQSDYLARRLEATTGASQKELWSAVQPIERALADCCELDGDENLDVVVEGALMIRKVIHFVELLAKYCYKVSLRILVITILERTLEQDELNRQEAEEEERDPRPNCFSRFLAAGGLKILNQWLVDAITPTPVKAKEAANSKPPSSKRQRTTQESASEVAASANGPLLIPLLAILERIPFDKALVTETRVNKTIRRIKKEISNLPKRSPDPLAGGYIVSDALKAIESLMDKWKESMSDETLPIAKDPLRTLHQTMQERLTALKAFESGQDEKPEFLEAFEETERLAKERKDLSKMTPEQRESKRALEEAQRKREEASKKMEELKKKRQTTSAPKKGPKKKVHWRDGKNQGAWTQQQTDIYYYEPEVDREDMAVELDNDDEEDMWS
jgi:hypothetical protein